MSNKKKNQVYVLHSYYKKNESSNEDNIIITDNESMPERCATKYTKTISYYFETS